MTEEWEASEIFYVYEVFANKKKKEKTGCYIAELRRRLGLVCIIGWQR